MKMRTYENATLITHTHACYDLSKPKWTWDGSRIRGSCESPSAARFAAMAVNEALGNTFGERAAIRLGAENEGQMRAVSQSSDVVVRNITSEEFEQATGQRVANNPAEGRWMD